MDELESMKYVLMTDDGGDVYTNAVVSYMKKNIGYETVKNLYSQYSSLNENKSAGEYDDSKIDSALKALRIMQLMKAEAKHSEVVTAKSLQCSFIGFESKADVRK